MKIYDYYDPIHQCIKAIEHNGSYCYYIHGFWRKITGGRGDILQYAPEYVPQLFVVLYGEG
jgi:hypothetical protein